MIRPYLSEGECKIKLIMSIKFMSSQNSEETRTTHTKSHNLEIIIDNETDHIINDFFYGPLLQNYQKDLEISMKASELVLDSFVYCIIIFRK